MGIGTLRRHRVHTHPGDGGLDKEPEVEALAQPVAEPPKAEPQVVKVEDEVEKPKSKKPKPESVEA